MRKLLPFLAVALFSCSKSSTLQDMNAAAGAPANATTAAAAAASTARSATDDVSGSWRRTEVRYNRGDGTHYWQTLPADQQTLVIFDGGKIIAPGHPYLGNYTSYDIPKTGTLHVRNSSNGNNADVLYTLNGATLELTFKLREDVVERLVKQ